jgi:hypothetical protein
MSDLLSRDELRTKIVEEAAAKAGVTVERMHAVIGEVLPPAGDDPRWYVRNYGGTVAEVAVAQAAYHRVLLEHPQAAD